MSHVPTCQKRLRYDAMAAHNFSAIIHEFKAILQSCWTVTFQFNLMTNQHFSWPSVATGASTLLYGGPGCRYGIEGSTPNGTVCNPPALTIGPSDTSCTLYRQAGSLPTWLSLRKHRTITSITVTQLPLLHQPKMIIKLLDTCNINRG